MALLVLGEDPFPWGFDITPEEALYALKNISKRILVIGFGGIFYV